MSKRLQVIMDDAEYREIEKIARRKRITVSAWVREVLRDARRREPGRAAERKLDAVRAAARHTFPTSDIAGMLADIERGYAVEDS